MKDPKITPNKDNNIKYINDQVLESIDNESDENNDTKKIEYFTE